MYICIYTYMYVCIYIYIYTCICIYIYIYIPLSVRDLRQKLRISEPPKRVAIGWVVNWVPSFALGIEKHA